MWPPRCGWHWFRKPFLGLEYSVWETTSYKYLPFISCASIGVNCKTWMVEPSDDNMEKKYLHNLKNNIGYGRLSIFILTHKVWYWENWILVITILTYWPRLIPTQEMFTYSPNFKRIFLKRSHTNYKLTPLVFWLHELLNMQK